MLKKALKIAITFGVLLAAHVGYVRLFAIVAERAARSRPQITPLLPSASRTQKEAIALAARAFGEGHWSADRDLQGRYYNHERGYWMYYKTYELRNDGKQLLFKPFGFIWQSRDKKELKTVLSDEAIIDLDRPLGQAMKPGSSALRVVHAQITGNVQLRDDKGTTESVDDLVIGPLPYVEYDEPTLQVRSDSDILIRDRDMWVNGFGLLIQLRPKDEDDPDAVADAGNAAKATPGGFNGAKTVYLKKNVHILLNDVGRSGILPGTARPEQTAADGRTPLDLRAAGEMQIDLPRPRLPVAVGPPSPPGPTLVKFTRDVVVLRGKLNQTPDQLNCDNLRLILLPGEKPPAPARDPVAPATEPALAQAQPQEKAQAKSARSEAGAAADPTAGSDSLGGLTLRRADANGHAVWLQSASQGTKTFCTELIYKKLAPEAPDETYLRGDPNKGLYIEKIEFVQDGPDKDKRNDGPDKDKRKIQAITRIWTVDATIFEDPHDRDASTIVARGPGRLETRPARDQPVERSAFWQDQLVMQNVKGADAEPRRQITLTGKPRFSDAQATLVAKKEIVVWLKPKPKAAAPEVAAITADNRPVSSAASTSPSSPSSPATSPTEAKTTSTSYQIETLRALEDVHLTTPGQKMIAHNVLVAVFENLPPAPETAAATNDGQPAPIATGTTSITNANPTPGPATNQPAVAATAASAGTAPDQAKAKTKAEAKPADPDLDVRADQVWARVALRPKPKARQEQGSAANDTANAPAPDDRRGAGGTQSEIQEVRLRGAVAFHQDPAAGKQRGTNVSGDAVDVTNLGENKMAFKVFQVDPYKILTRDKKAKILQSELLSRMATLGKSYPPARVETDEFTAEGPIIGLNQKTDKAWIDGPGTLIQLAQRGLLTDKGLDNTTTRAAKPQTPADAKSNLTPLKITWKQGMNFLGQSTNPQGVPVARAQFFVDVRAEMEDALVLCQEMTTYMDRVVRLNRPKRNKGADATNNADANALAEPEPKPQIALIDCLRKVLIISQKVDPETRSILLQKQQIEGERVTYNKLYGNFIVPGAGRVYLYSREGQDSQSVPPPATSTAMAPGTTRTADGRTVTPTAAPTSRPAGGTRRATEVVGRNTGNGAAAGASAKDKPKSKAANAAKAAAGADQLPLKLTQIVFNDEMHGRFGTGKETDTSEIRWADFFGDVQVLNSVVPHGQVTFNFDSPPDDYTFLTAQTIRVVSEPPPPGSKDPARNLLKAWQNANAATSDMTISADKITYDSLKELFYAYGDNGREVDIVQQRTLGQPSSNARGTAVSYNRKTGESQVHQPNSIQFVDDKKGIRPGVNVALPEPTRQFKKPLTPFKPPSTNYFERNNFNGR